MSADGVVEHFNVAKDIAACFLPSGIDLPADALPFQQLEEAFGHGVVMTVASSAHAWLQVVASQESLPLMACKLGRFNRSSQHQVKLPILDTH